MILLSAIAAMVALDAAVGATTVTVESDSPCPSASAIEKALDGLGGRGAPRPASATVRSRGDRLTVEFQWPGPPHSETRELAVESDCESRAQSAAVVIASWLGILPEAALVSTPLGAPPVAIPYATVADEARSSQRSAAKAPSSRSHWLGVGLGGSAGGGVVPGLRIELLRAWARSGFDFGWMASTLVSTPRSKSLDGGVSTWIRPALALEGMASWGGPRVRLAIDLGPLAGLTVAWGSGYPANHADESATWGVTAGLRLQVALASSRLWGELRIIDWLHEESLQHEIKPTGIVGSVDLPSWESLLSLGWSFAL